MSQEELGRYTLEERVAQGGMGEVWRARAPDGVGVCIKRLDPSLRDNVDFIEMFRDEASLVADLDHENVIRMIELIDTDEELAQVMEYVDGASLARIRSAVSDEGRGFEVEEALQIGVYLCRALHHAHTRTRDGAPGGEPLKIVHRDVSPQNILVDKEGRLKLVDFGIAKAAARLTRTQSGTLKGKLSYMAPEQARGEPLDHRADQFAAGILLWEMLTGRRLFGGRNELLILDQVQKSDPVPPSTVKAGVPRSVDRAVLRALRWHPDERFADTAAFERALQACLEEIVPGGRADLEPIVARTLARQPETTAARGGVVRTRVLTSGDGPGSTDEEAVEGPPPMMTDPLAQPEHTGQFFRPRKPWNKGALFAGATGAAVVALGIAAAVWLAEREEPVTEEAEAAPPPPGADVDALEAKLTSAPAHPCRTELLDDLLLDKSPLSEAGQESFVAAVDQCVKLAEDAPRLRAALRAAGKLETPPWPKKKKRTTAVIKARAAELARRGQQALAAGEYARAKELYVEAVALDPSRIDDHGAIGQAFRGVGDPAGAAHHLRLWLHARPAHPDRERTERYLARYGQANALKDTSEPGLEELHVRVERLLQDAEAAAEPVPLLESARELLPEDARVLLRLGDAYETAGRTEDAKRLFQAALASSSGAQAKRIKERLVKLGSQRL
jgi:tetratricopeptide (TPR) repeat protein